MTIYFPRKVFSIFCLFLFLYGLSYGQTGNGTSPALIRLAGSVAGGEDYYKPVYVPFMMPEGAIRLTVTQAWAHESGARANLDLGVFDARGKEFGSGGFRGWSGGARRTFEITESGATPGYIPGELVPGEWNVIMVLTSKTSGRVDWTVEITIETGGKTSSPYAAAPPEQKLNDTPGWYRIDTHVHTVHSDGKSTPEEVIALGVKAGLNGIMSADHNTTSSLGEWGRFQRKDFLVIEGVEVTYVDGHWNIFGMDRSEWIDFRYRTHEPELFTQSVDKAKQIPGAYVSANHPFSIGFFYDLNKMDGIEVWNGPWDLTDELAVTLWNGLLKEGKHKFAVGGSDYHRPGNVIGLPQTVIYSQSLSSPDVVNAIAKGNSYIAQDAKTTIDFAVYNNTVPRERKIAGETIRPAKGIKTVFSSNTNGNTLVIITQKESVQFKNLAAGKTVSWNIPEGSQWVRVELRSPDGGMVALSNPVFIE